MKNLIRGIFVAAVLFITCSLKISATHNRAGEITYVQLSDLTFEITITTFTYTLSFADRQQLEVNWGDNSTSIAERNSILYLPNFYKRNIYTTTHTYPGPGVYKIVVQDPNRNADVRNIPNSVNVVFSISTTLNINPAIGRNNTPVLYNPPYDKAARGYVFIHNPGAYDSDGDSLSYKLTVCTREDGKPIENYTLPPATKFIRVDSISGDLIWNTPADTGKYNVAMEISEWRRGKKIGMVVRDMQIEVYDTKNRPPVNGPLKNMCIEAGKPVDFLVTATDEDKDMISLKATSGVFGLANCPASFVKVDSVAGFASARFRWTPCFEAVRNQPYDVLIKSDDYSDELKLSDIDNFQIKVLGPSPALLNGLPEGKFIRLRWDDYGSDYISGFNIYRREGPSQFSPDSCTAGIPATTGFVKIGFAAGGSATSFVDTDGGHGLQYGKEYTYRIVAVFPNGTESKASNEISSSLVSGIPVITNVSIRTTSVTNGSVYISWMKPGRLDTIPANGPYEYLIYRAEGITGTDYQQIRSIRTATLNETSIIDTLINTRDKGYIYRIELYNNAPGNRFLIGEPGYASSLFLTASPGDEKVRFVINRNVPWLNSRYDFYRLNSSTMRYDSIGSTNQLTYTDLGLENGKEYCYRIRSVGGYVPDDLPKNLINYSQIVCATPEDNEPPCQPVITVTSQCDSLYNTIRWRFDDPECIDDVAGYYIYFKPYYEGSLSKINTIDNSNTFVYKHYPGDVVSGCYAVSAFDRVGNEGEKSYMVCIDTCDFYEIPNVFTPNGDNINDRLIARTSGQVEKVDMKIFNRYGILVFQTDEPRINWDGTYKGKIVSPGVYFYQCEVFIRRITGLERSHLHGFVHVITEKGAGKNVEILK
ncbi:MAG TPA: gliding motility-associated C-terminal domain-containing protein [Bacteroidales bacterium]|nr:T9SS type B sorting domain-containing protein [Bacteroidales bacterium]HNR41576.1 gliding motility-associated C-terminal domain-containing protein [Bacteroidales bacterium]HPM18015.1 gliding motility-associated C-terminal domain-containing protein [Bacteroidales bacterium]HQG76249.1 gliding motility-associated C-terminal domain-containing protein [Bacteroidales bacterium]